jgi:S-adenosylmethionine:tRNA ribosyltransferase-isomerase
VTPALALGIGALDPTAPVPRHAALGPLAPFDFGLPSELEAAAPPEHRGLARDGVRLLVARRRDGSVTHARFTDLPALLTAGDVLVVNTSATLPAHIDGSANGQPAALHLSGRLPGGLWMVELRHRSASGTRSSEPGRAVATPAGAHQHGPGRTEAVLSQPGPASTPWLDAEPGTMIDLAGGGQAQLCLPASPAAPPGRVRLWVASIQLPDPVLPYLARYGQPIRYSYVPQAWPISSYQTVFAEVPGSAEMPSAARPFSAEVITRLVSRGVVIAPFVLHCGVSSPEQHEPPAPEWYRIPATTAAQINAARVAGGRIIAVGTTAVRALETAADTGGIIHPAEGWTELVVRGDQPVRSVDGLITGWHEPGASHLAMLQAIAGLDLVAASYSAALAEGYLWHEFGDSHLVLP